jgi:hypothetical protein
MEAVFLVEIYCVGMFAQELAELGRDALNDWINGEDNSVRRLNRVARKEVENQAANVFVIISAVRQFFITLAGHQLVQRHLAWGDAFDEWLRGDDDGFAIFKHNTLQPDVIVKNLVLQIQPVEIFGRGCAARVRTRAMP